MGHARHIANFVTKKMRAVDPRLITREDFIDQVLVLMKRSRGRELPGTYNPHIVADLFYEQSKPWQTYVYQVSHQLWDSTMLVLDLILDHTADENTALGLKRHTVNSAMEILRKDLQNMTITVLAPHQRGHPITYNHYLTDNIQSLPY